MNKLESTGIKFLRYSNELVEEKLEGIYYHLLEQLKERENELRK